MGDRTKIHILGPGRLQLDGVDAGYVSNAKLTLTNEQVAAMTAAYGKTPLDIFNIGTESKFAVLLDEINMTQYAKTIQGAQRNVSGSDENISVGKFAGTRLTSMLLTFIPIDSSISAALSLTIWRVIPTGNRDVDFGIDKQQSLAVEFEGLIDESKADGYKLLAFGNISVVTDAVAPTAVFSPADDDTGVLITVAPTITFNKAMDPATLNGANIMMFTALDSEAQTPVTGTVSYNAAGTVATFTPTSSLSGTTAYNLIVTSGAKSASGIAYAGKKISFTTA